MNTLDYLTRKYHLNLKNRSPIEIPQIGQADLAKIFAKLGFTKGALVGTWKGVYIPIFCQPNPQLKLFAIDLNSQTPRKNLSSQCKLLRMTSLGAANKCVDNSLDFVYIDTNNEFTQTTSDIHEWVKKVRPGGIIAGHDYYHYRPRALIHMYQAVNSYASAYKIAPWFVVGRDVDRVRSWFWIKA